MKNFLITGGGGFVGGNFTKLLLNTFEDVRITVVDRMGGREISEPLKGLKEKYHSRLEIEKIDLNDERLKEIFSKGDFDFVMHFAAKNPMGRESGEPIEFAETNVERTVILLEEVKKLSLKKRVRFFNLSTYEVYGNMKEEPFSEEDPLNPTSIYAASKASKELFILAYHRTYNLDVVLTRSVNIYGPFQQLYKFIPMVISKALKGEKIKIFGDGSIIRDWIYIDDHNRAVLKLLEKGRSGEIYNIGANSLKSQIEVVETILNIIAHKTKKDYDELKKLVVFEKGRDNEDKIRILKTEKIEKEVGFKCEITFEEGLKKTVEWFLEEKNA